MNLFIVTGLVLVGACVCQTPTGHTGHHRSTVSHHGHHTPTGHTGHHRSTVSHHGHHTHTRPPHHGSTVPREQVENEGFLFHYSPQTHKMYIRHGWECYIAHLTADERVKVHSDSGIREIEVKLIQMMSIATNVTGQHVNIAGAGAVCSGRHHTKHYFTIP